MSGLGPDRREGAGALAGSIESGDADESSVGRVSGTWDKQQALQQWWCEPKGSPLSPAHAPSLQPAHPTHGSARESIAVARPTVGPSMSSTNDASVASATGGVVPARRRRLTGRTIGRRPCRVNRAGGGRSTNPSPYRSSGGFSPRKALNSSRS